MIGLFPDFFFPSHSSPHPLFVLWHELGWQCVIDVTSQKRFRHPLFESGGMCSALFCNIISSECILPHYRRGGQFNYKLIIKLFY